MGNLSGIHEDYKALIDSLLPFAQRTLGEHGGFHPFGAMMSTEGEVQWVAVDTGEEFPSGQAVIDGLTAAFQERAASGEIRAAAICYDALAIPPGETSKVDAIGFDLERRSGNALKVFLPYVRKESEPVHYAGFFTADKLQMIF